MYHLVFQGPKHQINPYYVSRRMNRASTHNQFELDTIRGSLKQRWEVHGFGTLEFQKNVWDLASSLLGFGGTNQARRPMHGHIIEVESAADAIWFRLNHENVSKNGCKLIEVYSDLDPDYITEQSQEYKRLSSEWSKVNTILSTYNSVQNNFNRVTNMSSDGFALSPELAEMHRITSSRFSKDLNKARELVSVFENRANSKASEILEYINSKKSDI